jgi:hypothetical protein
MILERFRIYANMCESAQKVCAFAQKMQSRFNTFCKCLEITPVTKSKKNTNMCDFAHRGFCPWIIRGFCHRNLSSTRSIIRIFVVHFLICNTSSVERIFNHSPTGIKHLTSHIISTGQSLDVWKLMNSKRNTANRPSDTCGKIWKVGWRWLT